MATKNDDGSDKVVVDCAVYDTQDICRLFKTNKNRIEHYIEAGTIPPPLPHRPLGRKLWLRTTVNRHLGIAQPEIEELIREIVRDELRKILPKVDR